MKISRTVLEKLKENGSKITSQRLSIINILFNKKAPLIAQEVIRTACIVKAAKNNNFFILNWESFLIK